MQNSKIHDLLHSGSPDDQHGLTGRLFQFFRIIYSISGSFSAHQGTLRAAALTYTTVLSLVPFLAIAFSVLKGLGAQHALEPLLQSVAGDSGETVSRIIEYVNNTNMKSIGVIGLVMLIVTVISLMGSIENAFNAVWGVRETRSARRRFSDCLSVAILGPILLLVATSMTSTLQSQWILQWLIKNTYLGDAILMLFRVLPYLSIWVAMVFLYIFIPNTKVRLASAVTGGVIAGTAWQLAQWGYFHFQIGVANYNAIYGTLAAVPVFLVWIYASWLIVLYGLEIVCAHQHHGHVLPESSVASLTVTAREELAVALLVQVNLYFRQGGAAPSGQSLADGLNVSLVQLEPLLDELRQSGYLALTSGAEPGWLPARDPSLILVSDIISVLRGVSEREVTTPVLQLAEEVVRQGWDGSRSCLEGLTVSDLLESGVK